VFVGRWTAAAFVMALFLSSGARAADMVKVSIRTITDTTTAHETTPTIGEDTLTRSWSTRGAS
jgi:hypothetical protein